MRNNLVSIITPSYNSSRFIVECVNSVISQTFQNWEMIIVDDYSKDNSRDIISDLSTKDERIESIFLKENIGAAEARNVAIRQAKGKYIAFLDSDDMWKSDKLEKQIALFTDKKIGFVYGHYWKENEGTGAKKIVKQGSSSDSILDDLLKQYTIGMLTLVVRRLAYDQLDYGFDKKFNMIGDFDLVIRLASEWKSDYVDEPIAHCRWHGNNFSTNNPQMSNDELKKWYEDIKNHRVISRSKELYNIPIIINYVEGMFYMRDGKKIKGLKSLLKVPIFRREKIKIVIAFLLPKYILNYFFVKKYSK